MGISRLDVTLGIRMLGRHPALSLVGGLGIAVGVAISVAMFSVINVLIYPSLPLDEGDRIVALENRDVRINNEERRSVHDFVTWREELESVDDLGAFRTLRRNLVVETGAATSINVAEMSAAGFRVARVAPLHGRWLLDADERPGAPDVMVIGYGAWQNQFGGDPRIIGREVRLGRRPHTIVGVMPEGFRFPENHEFWIPFRPELEGVARREGPAIFMFGRLAPGVTMDEAQAELETLGRRAAEAFPESNENLRPMVMPYTHSLGDVQGISVWEVAQGQAMMTIILLVVALNVAVLIYARTAMREGELAIRAAVGASRARIVTQLFVEGLVLSVAATLAGLALAQVGIVFAQRLMEGELEVGTPFWFDWGLQPSTVLFTAGLAILTAVIIGILPALQATRGLRTRLSEMTGGTELRLGKTWTVLIVGQVALAVALLPVAVNAAIDGMRTAATRPIYPAERFIAAGIAADPEDAKIDASLFERNLAEVLRRLEEEPGVKGVTFRGSLEERDGAVVVDGIPDRHSIESRGVASGYFDLFGTRVLAGRGFTAADEGADARTVIVNRAFVRRILGGENALGRRLRFVPWQAKPEDASTPWLEIVGVVEDLERNAADPELVSPEIFYALSSAGISGASVIVHVEEGAPMEFGERLRQIVMDVDPLLRVGRVFSLEELTRQERLAARLVGLAVGLVLVSVVLLSAAGIYALMSFAVTRRRREIGIRTALGAQPRDVLRSVFGRAAGQVAAGVGIGIAIAVGLEIASGGELMGGNGALILPPLALLMAVAGFLAAIGPARRGLRIQPSEALRAEK